MPVSQLDPDLKQDPARDQLQDKFIELDLCCHDTLKPVTINDFLHIHQLFLKIMRA